MTVVDLFEQGRLAEAIDAQRGVVREHPDSADARRGLAELLAHAGDLDGAEGLLGPDDEFRQLIAIERRRQGLALGRPPAILGKPSAHVRHRLVAVRMLADGRAAEAADRLDRADALSPTISGHLNGMEFEGLRDADDLFGPVLEVFLDGGYHWVGLEQVRRLEVRGPSTPGEALYLPARLTTNDGIARGVFLPALYPMSHGHEDEAVRAGAATDWGADAGGPLRGAGLRLFLVGDGETHLREWRQLDLRPNPGERGP